MIRYGTGFGCHVLSNNQTREPLFAHPRLLPANPPGESDAEDTCGSNTLVDKKLIGLLDIRNAGLICCVNRYADFSGVDSIDTGDKSVSCVAAGGSCWRLLDF